MRPPSAWAWRRPSKGPCWLQRRSRQVRSALSARRLAQDGCHWRVPLLLKQSACVGAAVSHESRASHMATINLS